MITIGTTRDKNLKVRVNEDEKRLIKYKADELGISVSEYLRLTMFNNAPVIKQVELSGIAELSYEINRIGNNINQIAYVANRNKEIEPREIKILLDSQKYIEKQLRNFVMTVT